MKKQSLLLFKNAFKQAFRNKIQLVGLIILVLLSSTIFSLMQTSLSRVSKQYDSLIAKSNLHDFVIDLSNTASVNNSKTAPPITEPLSQQQKDINAIAEIEGNEFIWDRVEARTIQLDNNGKQRLLKILTYHQNARIDKLIITSGYTIGDNSNPDKKTPTSKQVVINKEFAKKNNLTIGDTIRVQLDPLGTSLKVNYDLNDPIYSTYNWLKIVGYGVSADFTTPIIDQTTPIPNKRREGILYVHPEQFGLKASKVKNNYEWNYTATKEKITITSNRDREIYFVGKSLSNHKNDINKIVKALKNKYINTTDANANLVYGLGDRNYIFNNRTSTITATITGFKTLLIALLLIMLIITGITVVLITAKNIDNSRTQIGILKSLGYANGKILITALAYPMIAAFLGTILVFLPTSGLQLIVIHTFANYFNLDFGTFTLNGLGFIYCLILTFGFLSIIAWLISALTVIKKPIALIKNDSATANSAFSRMIKNTSINRPFLTRFRLSLFTSSVGKMAVVSLTMFLGTTLMTAAIIGPKIMNDNKLASYTGMNYKSTVEYQMPTYNSPFTMYKTYNPTLPASNWNYQTINDSDNTTYKRPNRDNINKYAQEVIDNNINSEAYAPMSLLDIASEAILNLGSDGLTFLNGKMFTKSFLNNLDESNFNNTLFSQMIAKIAWPSGNDIYEIMDKKNSSEFYNDATFNKLKSFYRDYRSTVVMSINDDFKDNGKWSQEKFKNKFDKMSIYNNTLPINEGNSFKDQINKSATLFVKTSDQKIQLQNEEKLLNNQLDPIERNNWINKIIIWFGALFYGRISQTVIQGIYSGAPYFIRQNIANAYNNKESPFNVSFNVIPYNKNTDELGTYFTGTPINKKFNGYNYPIKVYGLQNAKQLGKPSMMQLYDSDGTALNPLLEQKNNNEKIYNIVINQTIAKQLNLHVNDRFEMRTDGNVMKYKNDEDQYQSFDVDDINFENINSDKEKLDNNVTLLKQNTTFKDFKEIYFNMDNEEDNETLMLKLVTDGKIVNERDTKPTNYQVVGIYNGYGQPNAYIAKDNADQILHYDQTHKMLFKIFQKQWQGKEDIIVHEETYKFSKLETLNYKDFLEKEENKLLVQMFNHEHPIFNFKMSNSDTLPDITTCFSTSQIYGDYSAKGLKKYGTGSARNVSPLYIHHLLLNQVTALVDAILAAFIAFSLIISFFIILLTSNLIIYENRKTIATMKILGYSDAKITNIVIGMYLPIIIAMFIFGFPMGFFVVKLIVNFLAYNTTWVLPLLFTWWLPVVVGVIVFGIYTLTFIIDWYVMKKIKPIKTLNEID